jgi:uncharacterized repeat protein (TIGR01451 family)
VTNTGNVTLTDVKAVESSFDGNGAVPVPVCQATALAPGEATVCTATYTTVQGDIDDGSVTNVAVATATTPDGDGPGPLQPGTVTSDGDEADVKADQRPSATIVKTATVSTVSKAGDQVTYLFTVTNTGNVTLRDIAITEDFGGHGPAPVAICSHETLAPGQWMHCTAVYVVTQADIDAGGFNNTATVTANDPDGKPIDPASDSEVVTADMKPAISVVKTASTETVAAAGEEIVYTFTATNTGNVTLADVHIDESRFTGHGDPVDMADCADLGDLAPGESATCQAVYTVVQADIDAGSVVNAATAGGTPPDDPKTPGRDPETTPDQPGTSTVEAEQEPALEIVKTASPGTVSAAGDEITYTFTVTNTGNVTLTAVHADEAGFSGAGEPVDMSACADLGDLAPGESAACEAVYTVVQADIDAGSVTNAATAGGTPPDNPKTPGPEPEVTPGEPGTATVEAEQNPAITVVKTASADTVTAAGEVIAYTFTVTNTGNVTLTGVHVDEADFSGTGEIDLAECADLGELAPGESAACTADYTVTQADMDAGSITNAATAGGTPPDDPRTPEPEPEVTPDEPGTTTVEAEQSPALAVVKSATPTIVKGAGESVEYTFAVTNTGNVTLTDVSIDETAFGGTGGTPDVECPETPLAPGESLTCTATYEVTLADVIAGAITNVATAAATPPAVPGDPGIPPDAVSEPSNEVVVEVEQNPELTVVKTGEAGAIELPGDLIEYTFVVTNTGNLPLTGITVVETEKSFSGYLPNLSDIVCEETALDPGEQTTCRATYEVVLGDLQAGSVINEATAVGSPPDLDRDGEPDDPVHSDSNTVEIDASCGGSGCDVVHLVPSLKVVKTADKDVVRGVGDVITYTFEVVNDGEVDLTGIRIQELEFNGAGELSEITCEAEDLAVGESTTCTATYTVQPADMALESLVNTAIAAGTPPYSCPTCAAPDEIGSPIDDPDNTATVDVEPAVNQIKLVKSADRAHISAAGDQIVYSFAVTNLGDTTLTDVHVDDYQFSGTGELPQPTCPETTLEPGETVICTSVYIVTAEDVAAGTLTNTAVATGTPEPACSTCEEPEPISSAPDDPDVTVETPVRTNLPDTGTTVTQARVTIACTVAGIGLILSAIALGSRRRRQTATCQGGRDGVKRT